MKNKIENQSIKSAIIKVQSMMGDIMAQFQQIGDIIYAEHCKDEMAAYMFHESIPELSMSLIGKLIKIGKGDLDIRCYTYSCPAVKLLERMDGKVQKSIFDAGEVEVVKIIDNKAILNMRPINDLTPQECSLAFSEVGKRPIEHQKKLLVEKVQDIRSHQVAQTYEIDKGGNLLVNVAVTVFTPKQVEEILERMKQIQLKTLATKRVA